MAGVHRTGAGRPCLVDWPRDDVCDATWEEVIDMTCTCGVCVDCMVREVAALRAVADAAKAWLIEIALTAGQP